MIDIHNHCLWAMDDGPATIEQSLAMLRIALESGVTDIVATPHHNFRYCFQPDVAVRRIAQLLSTGETIPRLHYGCELHLDFDNLLDVLHDPPLYTINHGPYLLVELPDCLTHGMSQALRSLMDRGLIPIICHPERHPTLQRIPPEVTGWLEMGCRIQVTAQSLLGFFGRHAENSAWRMVERGLVQFVASDAHDDRDRTPRLDEAFSAIAKRMGKERAQLLCANLPGAVLIGDPIAATK